MTVADAFVEFIRNYLGSRLPELVIGSRMSYFRYFNQHRSNFSHHNINIVTKLLQHHLYPAGHLRRKSNSRSSFPQIMIKFDPLDVTPFSVFVLTIE